MLSLRRVQQSTGQGLRLGVPARCRLVLLVLALWPEHLCLLDFFGDGHEAEHLRVRQNSGRLRRRAGNSSLSWRRRTTPPRTALRAATDAATAAGALANKTRRCRWTASCGR